MGCSVDFKQGMISGKEKSMTGQLFFREQGKAKDGRRLFMVVGLVAVEDNLPIKTEHKYPVADMLTLSKNPHGLDECIIGDSLPLTLVIGTGDGEDMKEETEGEGVAGILTTPMWRV